MYEYILNNLIIIVVIYSNVRRLAIKLNVTRSLVQINYAVVCFRVKNLKKWYNKQKKVFIFAVLIIWRW